MELECAELGSEGVENRTISILGQSDGVIHVSHSRKRAQIWLVARTVCGGDCVCVYVQTYLFRGYELIFINNDKALQNNTALTQA
jgi:hypothetical protein